MVSQDSTRCHACQIGRSVADADAPTETKARASAAVYPDRLFLKALVIMIVRHLHNVHALLSVLAQPTEEMGRLRELLCEQGRFPARRTWERQMFAIPDTLSAQIGCLGRHLIDLIQPWESLGRALAIDSTVLRSRGGLWHQKHREKGEVPHSSIDTQARLPQIGLARLGLWLEIARRLSGRSRLVSHRCGVDPRQCCRERTCSGSAARSPR